MPITVNELLADLPATLAFLSAFQDALVTTKGQSPVERDFNLLIAVLPKLKDLAVAVEAQIAS